MVQPQRGHQENESVAGLCTPASCDKKGAQTGRCCGVRVSLNENEKKQRGSPELGGGPASYIPAHTSSALAASFRI